jgi:hypothetical protein
MSRKIESDLFYLIKSLTKSERKSFKQFVNFTSGEKKYLRLFELIDKQSDYNEDVIRKRLGTEKISTHFPLLKNYLLELILKSLHLHHSGKTIESEIQGLLAKADVCHKKGLIKLRNKLWDKVKRIANKYENYDGLLQLLNKKTSLISLTTNELFKDHEIVVEKIKSKKEYRQLIYTALQIYLKGSIREDGAKVQWNKIMLHPLLDKNHIPDGYEENRSYHFLWQLYYAKKNDLESNIYHSELMMQHLESRKDLLMENKAMYINGMGNLITAKVYGHQMGDATEALYRLIKILKWELNVIEKESVNDTITLGYCNVLHGFMTIKNFDKGNTIALQAQAFINNHNSKHSFIKSTLFFNLSTFYLITGNLKKALFWNNSLLNEPIKNNSEDVHAFGRIKNLILHYELKHDELMPYIIRSTFRFLYKRMKVYKTEDTILQFIRKKLPKGNSSKERIEFFKELKTELEKITKDPYEAEAIEIFDFISWLESKIENRPFADIVKEKPIRVYSQLISVTKRK